MMIMQVVQFGLTAAIIVIGSGWRPVRRVRMDAVPGMLHYAANSLGVRLLNEMDNQIPKLVVGATLGPTALGLLAVAIRISDILKNMLIVPLNAVALPAIARARAQGADVEKLFVSALRVSTGIANPAFFGLIAVAPLLLPTLLGEHWRPAVPVLQVLSLLGLRSAVSSFNGAAMRGWGRPDLQLRVGILGLVCTLVFVPIAAQWGIVAAAGAMVLRGYTTWPVAAWIVERLGVIRAVRQFTVGTTTMIIGAAMAALVLTGEHLLAAHVAPILLLGLAIAAGGAFYVLALWLFARSEVGDLLGLLRQFGGRQRA